MTPNNTPCTFDDTIAIQNESLKLEFSPSAGRIVNFTPAQQSNLIWLNTTQGLLEDINLLNWQNLGGDKVWPTQQSIWTFAMPKQWPPDPAFDTQPFQIQHHDQKQIAVKSTTSAFFNIQLSRIISLMPDPHHIRITNTFKRLTPSVFPVQSWAVSQAQKPNYVILDAQHPRFVGSEKAIILSPPETFNTIQLTYTDNCAVFSVTNDQHKAKVGSLGAWIAAVYDHGTWLQHTHYTPDNCYPDGSSVQLFACQHYIELETLGSLNHLKQGQSLNQTVDWIYLPGLTSPQPKDVIAPIQEALANHPLP